SLFPVYESRRYTEAVRIADEMLRVDSTAAFVRVIRAEAYLMQGQYARAIDDLRGSYALEHQPHFLAYLVYAEAKAGNRAAADSAFSQYQELAKSVYAQPYTHAIISLARGDEMGAIRWLERGVDA